MQTLRIRGARVLLACVALSLATFAPAHARFTCGSAIQMSDQPTSIPNVYPVVGYANGVVNGAQSHWYTGVFHDIVLSSNDALTLKVYDFNVGCLKPKLLCSAPVTGPSAPGRCLMNGNSQRHIVEVSRVVTGNADYALTSVWHCLRPPADSSGTCTP